MSGCCGTMQRQLIGRRKKQHDYRINFFVIPKNSEVRKKKREYLQQREFHDGEALHRHIRRERVTRSRAIDVGYLNCPKAEGLTIARRLRIRIDESGTLECKFARRAKTRVRHGWNLFSDERNISKIEKRFQKSTSFYCWDSRVGGRD